MNETYEWLYDHCAQPLIQVEKEADELKQASITYSGPDRQILLRDQLDSLCMLWGSDAFALSLQLGLRLMAGQRTGGPEVS